MESLAEIESTNSLAISEEEKERVYKTPIYTRIAVKRWQLLHPEETRMINRFSRQKTAHRKRCGCTAMNICNDYMLLVAEQQEQKRRIRILEDEINSLVLVA
jgi:hypothetical protein